MSLQSLTCGHCGGPLDVPGETRFVVCAHCGSRLEVKRTDSAIYTEVLEHLEQKTEQMAEDLHALRRQQELEQLDREWAMERSSLMTASQNGPPTAPSAAAGVIGTVIAAGFGIFWTVQATRMRAPGFFPLFGLLFIAIAIFGGISTVVKADQYRSREAGYLRRREELLRRE